MITFLQDDRGWACMAGSTALGRIDETPDGFVLTLGTRPPETFADIGDAQGRAMDIQEPHWRQEDAAAIEAFRKAGAEAEAGIGALRAKPQVRQPRRRTPWRGGPKQGTKLARAVAICDSILTRDRFGTRYVRDNRERSQGHAKAYDLASQAARMLSEAQDLSRHPSCRALERSLRGKGGRLLEKADLLMPEVRRIDREDTEAFIARLDANDGAGS